MCWFFVFLGKNVKLTSLHYLSHPPPPPPPHSAYINSGAVMEINIKHHVRKPLEALFGQEGPVKDVPIDVFDDAQSEILDLMRKDSLGRWASSPEYLKWSSTSIVVKNGQMEFLS
jgi:hypothetical protein